MIERGYWGMHCWNTLSVEQQTMLLVEGVLPLGRKMPEGGTCSKPAELEVTTMYDEAPGPRFFCRRCAIEYLEQLPLSAGARRARGRARGRDV